MSTYVAAYKGYIADVPEVWFKRCNDGRIFHFDEITQANATPNVQYTEINAGWSLYPVAYLPGQSSMEITMTSGQFNADLFALANGVDFEEKTDYKAYKTEHLEPDATAHTVTLAETPVANSVSIAGMEQDSTAGDGKFSISGKVITFDSDVEGKVEISYLYVPESAIVAEIDNRTTVIGEAVFKWPIYNEGDDNCGFEASTKGYVIMKIYRCRVTQMPGFDTSYKTAATNSVTWATMDPKSDDEKAYSIAYVEETA